MFQRHTLAPLPAPHTMYFSHLGRLADESAIPISKTRAHHRLSRLHRAAAIPVPSNGGLRGTADVFLGGEGRSALPTPLSAPRSGGRQASFTRGTPTRYGIMALGCFKMLLFTGRAHIGREGRKTGARNKSPSCCRCAFEKKPACPGRIRQPTSENTASPCDICGKIGRQSVASGLP